MSPISGFAAEALRSLTPSQISFLQKLPKAELHAHLNGSIPISLLRELAREYILSHPSDDSSDGTRACLEKLQDEGSMIELNEIQDFFGLFPAIYALTSTATSLARATRGVLSEFLDGEDPECAYLELRTTPREIRGGGMSRYEYVCVVLEEVERYPVGKAGLIVSLDRRMEESVVGECVEIVKRLKGEGRRIVGVDLCGDPMVCVCVLCVFWVIECDRVR